MYADDTVIYTHGNNIKQVAEKLTQSMAHVSEWLNQSCLKLNVNKTVSMFFSKSNIENSQADIYVTGEKIKVVSEFKYLGIIIDSKLTFKSQIKKVCNRVKFNIANFRFIRSNLSLQAAKMFMYCMVLSHITYCLTTWSQANKTTLKSLESLYKQTIKIMDKKPLRYHHCAILQKHKLLSWENVIKNSNLCLFYKIIHGLSSPPLSQFVNIRNTAQRVTRGSARGDCVVPLRKSTFSQSAFSVRAAQEWNSVPQNIRELTTYTLFKNHLKHLAHNKSDMSTLIRLCIFPQPNLLPLVSLLCKCV